MTRSFSRSSVLVVLCLALVGLGLALLVPWRGGGRAARGAEAELPTPSDAASQPAPLPAPAELVPPPVVERDAGEEPADTTVLWPLQIDLDLVVADYLPTSPDAERVGSGRTAILNGRIAGRQGEGVAAQVSFLAGPNQGTVLHCDSTGRFGSTTLYPGLALVEVRGPGIIAQREVRLRQRAEALLNLGFGRLSNASGIVLDSDGNPIAGADVNYDGHLTYTGADGVFYVAEVAGGQISVEVTAPGFAALRQTTYAMAGTITPREEYRMQRATTLRVAVPDDVGGPGPVQLFLLPGSLGATVRTEKGQQGVPWRRFGPIEMRAGSVQEIDGLPPTSVRVLAFRTGAKAQQKIVNLEPDQENDVTVRMQAAPMIVGRVLQDGTPVAGAAVRIEATNRVKATLAYFQESSLFLESEIMPQLPAAEQEVQADADGRFVLSAWDGLSAVRYLEARSPDGKSWAGRLVRPEDGSVDLELQRGDLGDSTLVLELPNRWQGLPVELSVNGAAVEPQVVPPYQPLRIESLLAGRWRVSARWHAELVLPEVEVDVNGETTRTIALPQEAIDGQDEEAWRRAGREFPFPAEADDDVQGG